VVLRRRGRRRPVDMAASRRRPEVRGRALLAALVVLAAAAACTGSDDGGGSGEQGGGGQAGAGPPVELRVLAGSELADMEPILEDAAEATGVTVRFEFVGTLEGIQRVVDGDVEDFDALWFSSNRYLALHPEAADAIRREQQTMTSPVVLGLPPDVARELGWDRGAEVGWADIARAAADGRFTYAMTNPAASNSGFSALVGVTAALSGTGAALEQPDIDAVAGDLRGFFSAQHLTAGSSGWLSDAYVARATGAASGRAVDGLVNYESVLLSLNAEERLPEPLTIVYPSDGVVTADYPLTLLRSASDEARDGYERLTDHLLTPAVQTEIMERTHRRPAVPEVEPDASFGDATLVELPFPARLDVVDGLIDTYFDRLRRPVRTVYVLDVSGSMEGERIESLRAALVGLTGAGRDARPPGPAVPPARGDHPPAVLDRARAAAGARRSRRRGRGGPGPCRHPGRGRGPDDRRRHRRLRQPDRRVRGAGGRRRGRLRHLDRADDRRRDQYGRHLRPVRRLPRRPRPAAADGSRVHGPVRRRQRRGDGAGRRADRRPFVRRPLGRARSRVPGDP
jgi:ABC-type Fe3+ transport system substrate-binding protein